VIVFVDSVSSTPLPINLYIVVDAADAHVNDSVVLDDDCNEHPPVILGAEITTLQSCIISERDRCDAVLVISGCRRYSDIDTGHVTVLSSFYGIFELGVDLTLY